MLRRLLYAACALCALWGAGARAGEAVLVLLSERGATYQAVSEALRGELPREAARAEHAVDDPEWLARHTARFVVAIGARACSKAAERPSSTPLLCALLPRTAFDSIAASAKGRTMSALVMDQPFARQLALVRAVLPEAREVGVILGPQSGPADRALVSAASAKGLLVVSAEIAKADELYPALQGVLSSADALIALPDATVYNSSTAQNIIRTAFHRRVPIIAFAPSYVQAGAALGLYSTPEQIGRQAGRWVARFLEGNPLPRPQPPLEFRVGVNERVARLLRLELQDEAALEARVRRLEQAR